MAIDLGRNAVDVSEAMEMLDELARKARDPRPWFRGRLDKRVSQFYQQQFDTHGRHGGQEWRPIAPLTRVLRSRRGHGFAGAYAVLRDTDGMRRAFVNGGGEAIRVIDRNEYRRGVRDNKAWRHQEGWTSTKIFGRQRRNPVSVPARPIVPKEMPRPVIRMWMADLTRWLEREGPI